MIFSAALRPPARNRLSDCGAATANRRFGPYHCDRLPDRVRRSEGSRPLSVQSRPELTGHGGPHPALGQDIRCSLSEGYEPSAAV